MGIARSTPIYSMQDHGAQRKLSFLEQGQRVTQGTTNSLKQRTYDQKLAMLERDLPETLDWRNKEGTNFLEPVMDQGDCAPATSCPRCACSPRATRSARTSRTRCPSPSPSR